MVSKNVASSTSREDRVQRLRKDEALREAYRDLVIAEPHIYTDEEFWKLYAKKEEEESNELSPEDTSKRSDSTASANETSNLSSALLADSQTRSMESELQLSPGSGFLDLLRANFDPATGRLKLVLTSALRRQIYDEFPLVRLAYDAQVPANMKPSGFWDAFFKAQLDKLLTNSRQQKEEAAKKQRKKVTTNKKGKTPPPPQTPTEGEELTWEQRQLRFFASLTDPLPDHLNRLVWQSKVSDALQHDPTHSPDTLAPPGSSPFFTSALSTSLLPLALEYGESGNASANSSANSPFVVARPPSGSTLDVEALDPEDPEAATTTRPGAKNKKITSKPAVAAAAASTSSAPSPLLNQQDSLRNKMLHLMQGSQPPPPQVTKGISSTSGPASASESGVITAEELLFSALREEANLEQTQPTRGGPKALPNSFGALLPKSLAGATFGSGDGSSASTKTLPEGAIELLDGLVVEAGELDESSMTELRREKEKRNSQLQLIRKFNRHSNLIVSASGDSDENGAVETRKETSEVKRNPPAATTSFGADTADDDNYKLNVDESTGNERGHIKMELSTLQNAALFILPLPSPPDYHAAYAASPSAMFSVIDELNTFLESAGDKNAPKRQLPPPRALSVPVAPSRLDIQSQDMVAFLARCDQWCRHFWVIVERLAAQPGLSVSTTLPAAFSFLPGFEKLSHVVNQLQEFDRIFNEMMSVETSQSSADEVSSQFRSLESHKRSIQRCMSVHRKLLGD